MCKSINEQLGQVKLVHNFMSVAEEDGCFKYRDRQNRMLDMSTENIDLTQKIDFSSSIKPLIEEKKLDYFAKIQQLQVEFNSLEESMSKDRLE